MTNTTFWIGCYTDGVIGAPGTGLRKLTISVDGHGELEAPIWVGDNPIYLDYSARDHTLVIAHDSTPLGTISIWVNIQTYNSNQPKIKFKNEPPIGFTAETGVTEPCHVTLTSDGEYAFIANYSGRRVTVHQLTPDRPARLVGNYDFRGSGPVPNRQEGSHPHQVVINEHQNQVYVTDLGADRIWVLDLQKILARAQGGDTRPLTITDTESSEVRTGFVILQAGAGPRHLLVTDELLVVANELDRTLSLVDTHTLKIVYTCPVSEQPSMKLFGCSAIRITRDRMVLVADRRLPAIHAHKLDPAVGTLSYQGTVTTGEEPRDLNLTTDERFAVVANQRSNTIQIIALNQDGVPEKIVQELNTPGPACILRIPK